MYPPGASRRNTAQTDFTSGMRIGALENAAGTASTHYPSGSHWFAAWTRSRQEKAAAALLDKLEIPNFLPLQSVIRQWSDRKQTVQLPLFAGYLFVRIDPLHENRLRILKTPGIVGLIGNHTGPLPIPDEQIDAVRSVVTRRIDCAVLPLLQEGDPVRVVRGPLAGIEGKLIRTNATSRLAISIALIGKSLSVSVMLADVESLSTAVA